MKRVVWFTLLAVMASTGLASAEGIGLGVGAYGGVSFPIIQDVTGGGGVFGLRAPVRVIPLITVEPFYLTSSLKDVDEEIGGVTYTRSGFDETAFGANVLFRFGSFYPFAGVGSYKLERNDEDPIKETGWSFGLGLAIPAGRMFTVDLRGELDAIVTGDTSRKFGNLTAGLTYNFNLGGGGGGGGGAEPQSSTPAPQGTTPTSQSTPPSGTETGGAAGTAGTTAPAASSSAPADSTQGTTPPASQTTPPQGEQTGGQK
jgi:hypothetical protein